MRGRLRSRATSLTRMVAEAYGQVLDLDPEPPRIVLASAWGELRLTTELLDQLTGSSPALSPTGFHNSVHNASTGYLSIATENRGAAVAISGAGDTLSMGFLEAMSIVCVDGQRTVLVVADESVPEPFACGVQHPPMAVAFDLRPTGERRARLRRGGGRPVPPGPLWPDWARTHPLAPALALASLGVSGQSAEVSVGQAWSLELGACP